MLKRLLLVATLAVAGFGGWSAVAPAEATAACRVETGGYPEFYSQYGERWVRTKVYTTGCASDTSRWVYVCTAFYTDQYYVDPYTCSGYVGQPDGWYYSFGSQCVPGRLYVTAYYYNDSGYYITNFSKFGC